MSNRLLLAERDPKSLRVLDVSLRSAGFHVETATTGVDAWAALERGFPDLVIAARDLAEIDGVELCTRLRRVPDGKSVPFILLDTERGVEGKVQGLQAGADDYLVKPVLVNDMVARVRALVHRRERDKLAADASSTESFSGNLSDMTPVDLLEAVAAGQRSGIIHLRDLRGAPGTIYFRRGVVVDAEVGRLSGPDAIGRLFAWSQGTFEIEWKNIRRPDAIGQPVAELVLDGMRRLDDWNHLASQMPELHDVFEVNYRVLAQRLAEIPDEVNGVLRLFDGSRSLAHVVEDSLLPDLEAMGMVMHLRDEGIIRPLPRRKSARERVSDGAGRAPPPPFHPDTRAESAPDDISSRMSAASGAVEESFANRMAEDASFPVPLSNDQAPTSGAIPPAHAPPPSVTRTAPGLGQSPAEPPSLQPDEVPSPPDVPIAEDGVSEPRLAEANVIRVPDETGSSGAASSDATPALPVEEEALPAVVQAPIPEQVNSRLHTQRGMGPFPASKPRAEPGSPDLPSRVDALPGIAPFSAPAQHASAFDAQSDLADQTVVAGAPSRHQADATIGAIAPEDVEGLDARVSGGRQPSLAATLMLPPSSATLILPPSPDAQADGAIPVPQGLPGADETARVSFPDNDLSRREAMEELGMPSGRRGLRILGVALVLGVVSAVVVQRFRAHGGSEGAASHVAENGASPAKSPPATPAEGEHVAASPHPPAVERPSAGEHARSNEAVHAPAASLKKVEHAGTEAAPVAEAHPPSPTPAAEIAAAARGTAPAGGEALHPAVEPRPSQPKPPAVAPGSAPAVASAPGAAAPAVAHAPGAGAVAAAPAVAHAPGAGAVAAAPAVAHAPGAGAVAAAPAVAHAPGAGAVAAPPPGAAPGPRDLPAASVSPPAALPSKPNTATATSTPPNDSNAPKADGVPDFARQLADCRAQFLKNRLRDASVTCAAALQSNPRSADALTLMAHVELNRGRLGRANDLAQKAVALDGKQADAYVIIGGVHQDSGRTAQAKAAYFRYLELAPHGRYADELRSIVGSL